MAPIWAVSFPPATSDQERILDIPMYVDLEVDVAALYYQYTSPLDTKFVHLACDYKCTPHM